MADEYPKKVVYCPNCGYPPEFCEYSGKFETCKPWLAANFPHLYPQLAAGGSADAAGAPSAAAAGGEGELASKMAAASLDGSAAGGSAAPADAKPAKKAKEPKGPKVYVEVREQGKRRKITTVTGLEPFLPAGTKLKEAASAMGKKFGAGATVGKSPTGVAQIDIQGDVGYDLPAILKTLYGVAEKDVDVKTLDD